ncbi:hypothetical protein L6452_44758 [Arctium lappa]|nr:hypothetical protein L6452_44758 [Arctium lappa]
MDAMILEAMVAEREATKRYDALRSEERGDSSRTDVTHDVSAPMHAAVNSTQELLNTGIGDDSQLKDTRRSVFQRLNYATTEKVVFVEKQVKNAATSSTTHTKGRNWGRNMDDAQMTTNLPGESILTEIGMEDLDSPRVDESSMGNEHDSSKATRQRLDGECSRPLKQS